MNWKSIPEFIGVALFSFEAIGIVFTIRNALANSKKFNMVFFVVNVLLLTT